MKKTPMFFRIPKEWQILKHFIKHAKHLIYEEPGVSFKSFSDQSLQNFSQVGAFTLNSRYILTSLSTIKVRKQHQFNDF